MIVGDDLSSPPGKKIWFNSSVRRNPPVARNPLLRALKEILKNYPNASVSTIASAAPDYLSLGMPLDGAVAELEHKLTPTDKESNSNFTVSDFAGNLVLVEILTPSGMLEPYLYISKNLDKSKMMPPLKVLYSLKELSDKGRVSEGVDARVTDPVWDISDMIEELEADLKRGAGGLAHDTNKHYWIEKDVDNYYGSDVAYVFRTSSEVPMYTFRPEGVAPNGRVLGKKAR